MAHCPLLISCTRALTKSPVYTTGLIIPQLTSRNALTLTGGRTKPADRLTESSCQAVIAKAPYEWRARSGGRRWPTARPPLSAPPPGRDSRSPGIGNLPEIVPGSGCVSGEISFNPVLRILRRGSDSPSKGRPSTVSARTGCGSAGRRREVHDVLASVLSLGICKLGRSIMGNNGTHYGTHYYPL